jgi:hypothetical protein
VSCQPTRDLRGSTRHDRRGGGEAGDAGSHYGDAGASGTGGVGRGSMKRWDSKGRIPMGALSHDPPAIKSGRAGCASDHRRQPGQQLDQPAGEASNKSTKVEREGRLEAGSRSAAWRCDAVPLRGPERRRSKPEGEASWKGSERRGRSRRQKGRDDGGVQGAAGSLCSGQAARGRVARSGGAKPKEAAHRQRFYTKKHYNYIQSGLITY